MPETSPPPIPGRKRSAVAQVPAWAVVLASVFFLTWKANHAPPVEEPGAAGQKAAAVSDPAEATELALLKIQARLVVGLGLVDRREALRNLRTLESQVSTPRGKAALAVVNAFVDQERGLSRARRLLGGVARENPAMAGLVNRIRDALENGVTEVERTELEKEIGWFSQMLRPANGDFGEAAGVVRAESARILAVVGGFATLGFLGLVTGLVLLIVFFTMRSSGRLKMRFDASASTGSHLFLESFAVYIGLMVLGQILSEAVHEGFGMASYGFSFAVALFWPVLRGGSWRWVRNRIGWTSGDGFLREIWAGVLGYLGIIVIAVGGLVITAMLLFIYNLVQTGAATPESPGAAHPIVGMMNAAESLSGKLFLLFLAAGLAPFFEETMFRGCLFRYFRRRWGFFLSALIGGLMFAMIHPQGWFAVPALAGMGMGFALLREWRDSLIASMTAHALNNGILVGLLFLILG